MSSTFPDDPNASDWHWDSEANYEQAGSIGAACRLLGCPPSWTDQDGYSFEITAAALRPGGADVAWVECEQKQVSPQYLDIEFRLKVRVGGRLVQDWAVETYNPFFGCEVGYMAWYGDSVVMVYREKHDTYVCSLTANGEPVRLREASDYWRIVGGQMLFHRWGAEEVDRLSLPQLEPLAPLTGQEAQATGLMV